MGGKGSVELQIHWFFNIWTLLEASRAWMMAWMGVEKEHLQVKDITVILGVASYPPECTV